MLNQQNQISRIEYLEKMLQDMHYVDVNKNYSHEFNIFKPYCQHN